MFSSKENNLSIRHYIKILGVQSARELVRYKSFFLLILIIIAADRVVKRYVKVEGLKISPGEIVEMGPEASNFIFNILPEMIIKWFMDYRAIFLLAAVFIFKQIVSLWPSSDMRRMHRHEREGLGIFRALLNLGWRQVIWDACAVGSLCIFAGVWIVFWFNIFRFFWCLNQATFWTLLFGLVVFIVFPLIMAGFSYSSKIAVLSQGSFSEKLKLFYRTYFMGSILFPSWVFFMIRIVVEFIFVLAIPGAAILLIPNFILRIIVAGISATLVYSYLKMATFKFFLLVYARFPYVREEYTSYYDGLQAVNNHSHTPSGSKK